MSLIPCTFDCIYQNSGECFLDRAVSAGKQDSGRCAYDSQARIRFNKYIMELNRELMTNYGKIDVLWYDVPQPMESHEGWNSLELNQMVRSLQPDIIINNRSRLDEDFQTPEGIGRPA